MAPPNLNLIVKPLGPIVAAFSGLRNSLYAPPRTTIAGVDESLWPNPLQPVQPMGPPKAEPLRWPFNWGRNLIFTPREDAFYSAADLRRLATYPVARICIENTKDMLTRMPRKIQVKAIPGETSKQRASRSENDPNISKLNAFIDRPNPSEDWAEFLRPILDDLMVIDAPAIFMGRSMKTGKISELRWVEGASITRLVEEHGWTPQPPNPAYQQNWQGYPRVDLTTDQLIYRPRNIVPRNSQSSYMYGMSPTEQVADEIKVGMARLQFILDFYTEGSIPGMIIFAPVGTPPDKIKEAQQFLDSDLAGQLAKRRRMQILQGFQQEGKNEQVTIPKEPSLTDVFDDLHIRKICFTYGTSPQRLMRLMNRSSAETAQQSAEEEGTIPWMKWLKGTIDYLVQVQMGYKDYELVFDPFHEMDVKKLADADETDVKGGLYTRNEKRVARGDDPRPEPEADQLMVTTAQGIVPLNYKPPAPTPGGASGGASASGSKPAASPSASSAATKTNGKTEWHVCSIHKGQYPRSFCSECIKANLQATSQESQASAAE